MSHGVDRRVLKQSQHRSLFLRAALGLLVLAAVGFGCTFDVASIDEKLTCRATGDCQPGLSCSCGVCVSPDEVSEVCGTEADAGVDTSVEMDTTVGQDSTVADTDEGEDSTVADDGGLRCETDAACGADRYCDLDTGLCVDNECTTPDDCDAGNTCEAFRCVPISNNPLCMPGSTRCLEDETAVEVCSNDGASWTTTPCSETAVCVDPEGVDAACVERVCNPEDPPFCSDGDVKRCNSNGMSLVLVTVCEEVEICVDGVCGPDVLTLVTQELPRARVGELYEVFFEAAGGVEPYTWEYVDGDPLPATIVLAGNSLLGTPTVVGLYRFSIEVADADEPSNTERVVFELHVDPAPLEVVTTEVPEPELGVQYSAVLSAEGGVPPYRWIVGSGELPAGLTLAMDGTLSGLPQEEGTFLVTLRAIDSTNATADQGFMIDVQAASSMDARQLALQGNLLDISTLPSSRRLAISDLRDGLSDSESLGFNFTFYGEQQTNVFVSTNGFVTFGALPDSGSVNASIPSAGGPDAIVAVFWDDLNPLANGEIFVNTLGVAPYRRFVVQWKDVEHALSPGSRINAEIVLYETSNQIQLLYGVSTNGSGDDDAWAVATGAQAVAGIENRSGNLGEQLSFRQIDGLLPGQVWLLTPNSILYERESWSRVDGVFNDISSVALPAPGAGVDNGSQSVDIGFTFNFYGNDYTTAWISSNGFLTFNAEGAAERENELGEDSGPNAVIAPFWDDLRPGDFVPLYHVVGNAPNRQFVVQWSGFEREGGSSSLTFQAILHETSNHIAFHYGPLSPDEFETANGSSATVGIEDAEGSRSSVLSDNTPMITQGASAYFLPTRATDTPAYVCAGLSGGFDDIRRDGTWLPVSNGMTTEVSVDIGFDFSFYGVMVSEVVVTPYGLVLVGDNTEEFDGSNNLNLPSEGAPNGLLAPFWDDLGMSLSEDGGIYAHTRGEPGSMTFVVQWQEVSHASDSTMSATFQMIFEQESGQVRFNYGPMLSGSSARISGSSATIGAENFDGNGGTLHTFIQTNAVLSGSLVLIVPQ